MLTIFLAMLDTPDEQSMFTELYETYRGQMLSTAVSILHDEQLAEDAVNQAFLKLIKSFSKIKGFSGNQTRQYLVSIVRNVAIDMYNKRQKIIEVSFDEAYDLSGRIVDDSFIAQLEYNELLNVVEKLPEIYFDALFLSSQFGFTVREIADTLNLSISGVKLRLMRGRQKLSALLKEVKAECNRDTSSTTL